jgi:2-dehydro-3-deoxyglucarate aldolase
MVESAEQLLAVRDACRWPPSGTRGVGFSRANLFGKHFKDYSEEAQAPLLIAMIENINAINSLERILKVDGLDAILIGPYDLSASMGLTGQFEHPIFEENINKIKEICLNQKVPFGIHIIDPSLNELNEKIKLGYRFIAYSIDAVFLNSFCISPLI